jgi:phosphopantetheine adenylyltransferase
MERKYGMVVCLLSLVFLASSCNFTQEDLQNKAKEVFVKQVSKIDSTLVKKIDHQAKDVDSLINQTSVKSIRNQIEEKMKDVDTLVSGIKKSVGN